MRKVNDPIVTNGPVKALIAWTAFGITSWTDVAAALAALYSLILIGEWVYKLYKKHKNNEPKG